MRRLFCFPLIIGAALTAACSDSLGPEPQFSQQITIDDLEGILAARATRVKIKASAGAPPVIADEVEVQGADEVTKDERIESSVEQLIPATSGCGGTLTLALGGIEVQFNSATEFEGEDSDELSCTEFVGLVQDALDQGKKPAVKAVRDAPSAPQAPDDDTFIAAELELGDGSRTPEIRINVAAANLQGCGTLSAPPAGCLGVLKVLNVPFLVVDGTTELEAEMPDLMGEVDFEGVVASVDPGASCTVGTVTLVDGTVIRVVVGTDIKDGSGDDDQLDDLCEVEDALAADMVVEADGEGVVTDTSPLTLIAIEIEFEVEEELEDVAGEVDFEGRVASVDREAGSCGLGTVTLAGGTVIKIVTGTEIDARSPSHDRLENLCQVAEALEDDQAVVADGRGVVADTGPRTIVASRVRFEIED